GFEGECCLGTIDTADACCPPSRIAVFEGTVGRCCRADEVVVNHRCVKSRDLPPLPSLCVPPGRRTLLGSKCCFPPHVPRGLDESGLPDWPRPPAPPPAPPVVSPLEPVFFKFDRPFAGEGGKALSSAATHKGQANFDALVESLKKDRALKVHLIGRASPEGSA